MKNIVKKVFAIIISLVIAIDILALTDIKSYAEANIFNISEVQDETTDFQNVAGFYNDTGEVAYIHYYNPDFQIVDSNTHRNPGDALIPDSVYREVAIGAIIYLSELGGDVWQLRNNYLYNHKKSPTLPNNVSNNVPNDVSNNVPVHIHSFVTGTIYEATCDHDGLEGTYCSTCGFIKESSPISAFGYTLETYAQQKMDAAKSGQTILLEFGELSSFPKSFMEKVAQKVAAGVSFEFRYKVNHKLQKIKIPAYSTVDTSLDWYGYGKMAELYGMN